MLKRGQKSKAWHGSQIWPVPVLVISLILIILRVYYQNVDEKAIVAVGFSTQGTFDSVAQMHPTVEFRNGTDVIWQVPDSPKAILFLAHGCNGRAINFWDPSPACRKCVGLPEERLIALHSLARHFAVITISSAGRCWTLREEVYVVKDILKWWVKKQNLEKFPMVALGASSGGYFVSMLATTMKFNSIILMIAEGMFEEMDISKNYPPTLFVHMPKDLYRQQKIDNYIYMLRDNGIEVGVIECMEFAISPTTLTDRIPGVDKKLSAKIFEVLKAKGFINENGYMQRDGRAVKWEKAVREDKNVLLDKNLVPHIQEELNLAFAYHEMTSLHSDKIFAWIETHMIT